jgi:O-methyltransferase involved in polyketide biosynthesis
VLTYRPPPEYLDEDSHALLKAIEPTLAQLGEPFLDGLAPAEFAALVRDCGFTVDEDVEPAELEARYFADRNDGLRPYSLERILSASLP